MIMGFLCSTQADHSPDRCFIAIMFQIWFCHVCGLELCHACYSDLLPDGPHPSSQTQAHPQSMFIPVSNFSKDELSPALDRMKALIPVVREKSWVLEERHNHDHEVLDWQDGKEPVRVARRFKIGEIDQATFRKLWAAREPIVITGVVEPQTLNSLFDLDGTEEHKCTVAFHDGESWVEDSARTLENYFSSWDQQSKYPLQVRVSQFPFSLVPDTMALSGLPSGGGSCRGSSSTVRNIQRVYSKYISFVPRTTGLQKPTLILAKGDPIA